MNKEGCWIFLSHSSKDIKLIRQIRNAFEERGHNPLAFHLLCLSDNTEEGKAELDSLIKREIDAREWFVFCESKNSKKSKYVEMEKEYIKGRGKKKVWSIDLSLPFDEIIKIISNICTQIKLFVSYAHIDKQIAKPLIEALIKKDFDVWVPEDASLNTSWHSSVVEQIRYGYSIILLTEEYVKSNSCMIELRETLKNTENAIILAIGNIKIPFENSKIPYYRIPVLKAESDLQLIADLIEADVKRKIKGPMSQGEAHQKYSEIQEKLNYEGRFHPLEAELVAKLGASEDYCEVYKFPCCGTIVQVSDGPISRFRADGCVNPKDKLKELKFKKLM